GASEMKTLLTQHQDGDLRSYWIWGPYLHSDKEDVARQNSTKFAAPSGGDCWTPSIQLAQGLATQLRLQQGRLGWDVYLLYARGVVWGPTFPLPTYWQHQIGVIQGEPLSVTRLDERITEALRKR